MEAQCELKAAGKPYPRTCPVCKLGPCQRFKQVPVNGEAPEIDAETRLAEVIEGMTYGELSAVAARFRDIGSDRISDGEDFSVLQTWMSLLHDWATTTLEPCDS